MNSIYSRIINFLSQIDN